MTRVRIFITHDVVFPGEPSSFGAFRDLLRTLSRTDMLFTCARFLHTLDNSGHHDDHLIQNRTARRFLDDEHLERINAWARSQKRSPSDTTMFFRGQILDLMCWAAVLCNDLPGDRTTFNDLATRVRFVRAALMISDAWGANVYADCFESSRSPEEDLMGAAAALRRGMAFSSSRASLLEAIARGASIYGPRLRERAPAFEAEFCSATGLTFDEYLALAGALAAVHSVRSADVLESNTAIFLAPQVGEHLRPEARDKVPAFLDLISQSPDQLAAALDANDPMGSLRWDVRRSYRAMRNRPILRTPDGRMIVLDPAMMCDALTMGPLFATGAVVSRAVRNTLSGAFGDAVEAYVATLLEGMYPSSPPLAPRLVLGPSTGTRRERRELCDAVLHGVDAVALFEVKGVFIGDDQVLDPDPSIFRGRVIDQYASPVSGSGRAKGATQLARAITQLAAGEAQLEGLRLGTTIYPVLIAFDDLISAPGTSDIICDAFARALGTTTADLPLSVRGLRVAPLTIMTVTDVELLDRLVETTELLEVLRAYTTRRTAGSFHDHLSENQTAYGIVIHGRQVTEIAGAAFDRAKAFLFGDQPPTADDGVRTT